MYHRYDLNAMPNHARRQATSKPIVSFDEQAVKDELPELVRKTIEATINAMLSAIYTRRIWRPGQTRS